MHRHLRAWRKRSGLSLEQVGNILGKRPSTIGRWEVGAVKLTTANLEQLASLYSTKPSFLLAPPEQAALVEKLDLIQNLLSTMTPEDEARWLDIGRSLARVPAKE